MDKERLGKAHEIVDCGVGPSRRAPLSGGDEEIGARVGTLLDVPGAAPYVPEGTVGHVLVNLPDARGAHARAVENVFADIGIRSEERRVGKECSACSAL